MKDFAPDHNKPLNWRRGAAAMCAMTMSLTVAACSNEGGRSPERGSTQASTWFVDKGSTYYNDLQQIAGYEPKLAGEIQRISDTAVPVWVTRGQQQDIPELKRVIEQSNEANQMPLVTLYHIPDRDIGQYSAGGADDSESYSSWLKDASDVIGDRDSVVILEPDALAHLSELPPNKQEERIDYLAGAIDTLYENNPNTMVYLDAGNATWMPAQEIAKHIAAVNERSKNGVSRVSLNVSNYESEENTREYAEAIQASYDGELKFIIDNSRNGGNVAQGEWCNPVGQKIGHTDNIFNPQQKVETVFVKHPGQSDGECGISGKPAGQFDGELLIRQVEGHQ